MLKFLLSVLRSTKHSPLSSDTMLIESDFRDFPGDPVFKNPPSKTGDTGSIPGQELRSHMSWGN